MSLHLALGNALSGLAATARMAEIVAANLAGAQTDGYGRRTVELSSASLDGRGAGVRVDGIARHADRALLAERREAETALEGDRMRAGLLRGLEGVLVPADGGGLADRIAALETALVAAAADPASEPRLGSVLDALEAVATGLREAAGEVQARRAEADARAAHEVQEVNAALAELARLNAAIPSARAAGRDAAGLLDQRQVLVDRIARALPLREVERPGGAIVLFTTGGATLLEGTRASRLGLAPSQTVTAEQTAAAGGLSSLTLDGRSLADPGGGVLGAALGLRDRDLPALGDRLDRLAADLVERLGSGADPLLPAAQAGLLVDGDGPAQPERLAGLAGRIAVTAAVDPGRGGALWRLRDGLGAVSPGPPGTGDQILRWLDALAAPRPLVPDGQPAPAAGLAATVASGLGRQRLAAEDAEGFAAARWSTLREVELARGVSTDAELQMLLRIEQAHAAHTRIIAAVDAMMRRLTEI